MTIPDDVEKSLTIHEDDDIGSLIKKMRRLERFFRDSKEYTGFAPFLQMYRKITEDVHSLYKQNVFTAPAAMEELDLIFAERYMTPIRTFLFHDERQKPWQTYLDYVLRDDRYESISMVLGINAHVNGDLMPALTASPNTRKEDYDRINSVLEKHLTDSLHYLMLTEHDKFAAYAELLKPVTRYEMHQTVIKWRQQVWTYTRDVDVDCTDLFVEGTEQLAEHIIEIGHDFSILKIPFDILRVRRLCVPELDGIRDELPPLN